MALQYSRLTQLQRLFFKYHPSLKELALSNCGTLQKRSVLEPALKGLDFAELQNLVVRQLRSDIPPDLFYMDDVQHCRGPLQIMCLTMLLHQPAINRQGLSEGFGTGGWRMMIRGRRTLSFSWRWWSASMSAAGPRQKQ